MFLLKYLVVNISHIKFKIEVKIKTWVKKRREGLGLKMNIKKDEDEDNEIEELERNNQPIINSAQALNGLNDLRNYLLIHKNDFSNEIDALYKLENLK
jgi:hypothetical protein